jgi:Cd2+/Zn2+-exporting ATPase
MADSCSDHSERGREILVLVLAPALILVLILISWLLAHWHIGPVFLNACVALVAVLLGGTPRFIAGFKDVARRRITVNVFVTVALAATVAIGEFRPAAIIILIMSVVGALESYALDKTRRSIRALLNLAPHTAKVRRNGAEVTLPVAELLVGDLVVARPGERIPVDGTVVAGASSVNQAPITGESMPVEKLAGSPVFSGTFNLRYR